MKKVFHQVAEAIYSARSKPSTLLFFAGMLRQLAEGAEAFANNKVSIAERKFDSAFFLAENADDQRKVVQA